MRSFDKAALCISGLLVWSCHAQANPESLRIPHPDDPSKQVEYFLERPSGEGPWGTVILLHGYQEGDKPGGKEFADWGVLKELAGRGYLAVAISQPGFGKSSGPDDYCGPFAQHAVEGVIAQLRAQHLASTNRLLIEGVSRGAVTAGLVGIHDATVSGLILISGVYDFEAYAADSHASAVRKEVITALIGQTGGTPDALRARSVLVHADEIKANTLIMNGAKDERTDARQAQALADRITRAGGKARAIIYPDFGHYIPIEIRNKEIDPFINAVLRGSPH